MKIDWNYLNKQRSIKELFDIFFDQLIEKISTVILIIFVSIPITSAFFNNYKYNLMYSQVHWYNANLIIGFLGLLLLVGLLIKRKYQDTKKPFQLIIKENSISFLLVLFLCWVFISVIFAENYYYAIIGNPDFHGGLISYFMYLGLFVLASRLSSDRNRLLILDFFVFTAFVMVVICLINEASIMAFLNFSNDSGNFGNSNHYGYYLVMAIMINETLIISKKNKYLIIFHLIELFVLVNGLINAKSMGPLLAVTIGTLALVILTLIKEYKKFLIIICIISVVIISGSVSSIGIWDIRHDVFVMGEDIKILKDNVLSKEEKGDFGSIGSSRGELWSYGIKKILERPLVGYGPNNFEIEYQKADFVNHKPHNEFIEIAGTFGLIGLFLYLIVLLIMFWKFIKNFLKIDFLILGLYCSFGAYLISSFFGNILYTTFPLFLLVLFMSINKISAIEKTVFKKMLSQNYHISKKMISLNEKIYVFCQKTSKLL